MFAVTKIGDEKEARRRLSAFTSNLLALLGLLVLGFPVSAATIRTTVGAWTLTVVAATELFVLRIRPQVCHGRTRTIRQAVNDLSHYAS
jgi:hypothetical protein